eukprot:5107069-Amphidinium_carterae.1
MSKPQQHRNMQELSSANYFYSLLFEQECVKVLDFIVACSSLLDGFLMDQKQQRQKYSTTLEGNARAFHA